MFADEAFRDPRSLAADLRRLERHYETEAVRLQAEAERLKQESRDASLAARECQEWRANLQQLRS